MSALWDLSVECREDVDMKTVSQGRMSKVNKINRKSCENTGEGVMTILGESRPV